MSIQIGATSFLTPALARQTADLRDALNRASDEFSTGIVSDIGKAVQGSFASLKGLEADLSRMRAYGQAISEAELLAQSMQAALSVIDDVAQDVMTDLTGTSMVQTELQMTAMARKGAEAFKTAISMLNMEVAGRSLFAGVETTMRPLPEDHIILAGLEPHLTGLTSAMDIRAAVENWVADPAGFGALYQGGTGRQPIQVAPGESVDLGATALDPKLRETLVGLSMMALIDRGGLQSGLIAQRSLAEEANQILQNATLTRTELMAGLGLSEEKLMQAKTANAAQETALGLMRNSLIEAEPEEAATRLKDLESRLDSLYTILSRLSRLSLTEYLR